MFQDKGFSIFSLVLCLYIYFSKFCFIFVDLKLLSRNISFTIVDGSREESGEEEADKA